MNESVIYHFWIFNSTAYFKWYVKFPLIRRPLLLSAEKSNQIRLLLWFLRKQNVAQIEWYKPVDKDVVSLADSLDNIECFVANFQIAL